MEHPRLLYAAGDSYYSRGWVNHSWQSNWYCTNPLIHKLRLGHILDGLVGSTLG